MEKMMTAWVKKKGEYGFVRFQKPIPEPGPNEALISVIATGICGTDHGIYKGYREVSDELTPGHEFFGEIVKLGADVEGYEIGDRVIPSIVIRCGRCSACLEGHEGQCENLLETGIHIDGSFAEYVLVPSQALHKAKKDFPPDAAASVEPVAVAWSAIRKVEGGVQGKDVIINGAGAIGLYIAQLALLGGARTVIVLAFSSYERLSLAGRYGAKTICRSTDDLGSKLCEFLDGGKAHVFFEASGVASTINEFVYYMRPHGQIVLIGVYKEEGTLDLTHIMRSELRICGTFCYLLHEFEDAIKFVEAGKINFDGIMSRYSMDELPIAMEKTLARELIKPILLNPAYDNG